MIKEWRADRWQNEASEEFSLSFIQPSLCDLTFDCIHSKCPTGTHIAVCIWELSFLFYFGLSICQVRLCNKKEGKKGHSLKLGYNVFSFLVTILIIISFCECVVKKKAQKKHTKKQDK